MKLKSLFVAVLGLFGLSAINPNVAGAQVLSSKMVVKAKSFEDARQASQDFTVAR